MKLIILAVIALCLGACEENRQPMGTTASSTYRFTAPDGEHSVFVVVIEGNEYLGTYGSHGEVSLCPRLTPKSQSIPVVNEIKIEK